MGSLDGKIALITGASSGIGLAVAQRMATEGAALVITGRSRQSLDDAIGLIPGDVLAIVADAGRLSDIDLVLEATSRRFGRIDVMYLNAGPGGIRTPFEAITEEAFDEFLDTNYKGPYFTIQKALPVLSEASSIVLCSSIANRIGQRGSSVYAGAKAALRELARSLATELAPRGIRVNVVSPGFIDTAVFDKRGDTPEMRQAVYDMVAERTSLGRIGTADEVAAAVVFLASAASSYVVGAEIVVDGGYTVMT